MGDEEFIKSLEEETLDAPKDYCNENVEPQVCIIFIHYSSKYLRKKWLIMYHYVIYILILKVSCNLTTNGTIEATSRKSTRKRKVKTHIFISCKTLNLAYYV